MRTLCGADEGKWFAGGKETGKMRDPEKPMSFKHQHVPPASPGMVSINSTEQETIRVLKWQRFEDENEKTYKLGTERTGHVTTRDGQGSATLVIESITIDCRRHLLAASAHSVG